MLKCGMAEVLITPPLGSSIPGRFEDRRSSGVKDHLFARAWVVESDGAAAAVVSLDCCDLTRELVSGIRERIREETGIPAQRIMVSATHTHTGPPIGGTTFYGRNEEYETWLAEQAAAAAIRAYRQRGEARIGFGSGREADIAFNRRFFMKDGSVQTNPGIGNPGIVRPAGPIDPEVLVIRIDDAQGKPIGVVVNYACHTDTVGGTEYSADYPGELSRRLKQELGEDAVVIFLMGTSGNINHADAMNGQDSDYDPSNAYYRRMGRILAWEVLRVREKIKTSAGIKLDARQSFLFTRYREPSEEDVRNARRVLADSSSSLMKVNFAKELLAAAQMDASSPVETELQAIVLGDLAIVGVPGELFVEFGLELKAKSPYPFTLVNELCNGSTGGYICTREAYLQGGYEPIITSSSRHDEDTGELIVQHSLQMLQEIGI